MNGEEKPIHCPCCGEGAEVLESHASAINEYWVFCHSCKLRTGYFLTRQEAIAAWNQRAGPQHIRRTRPPMTFPAEFYEPDEQQSELATLRALRVEADAVHEDLTHYGRHDLASIGQIHGWRERLRHALDKCKEAELSAPGDPCVGCRATNHCPVQNPCPVKQIWLEGREKT